MVSSCQGSRKTALGIGRDPIDGASSKAGALQGYGGTSGGDNVDGPTISPVAGKVVVVGLRARACATTGISFDCTKERIPWQTETGITGGAVHGDGARMGDGDTSAKTGVIDCRLGMVLLLRVAVRTIGLCQNDRVQRRSGWVV